MKSREQKEDDVNKKIQSMKKKGAEKMKLKAAAKRVWHWASVVLFHWPLSFCYQRKSLKIGLRFIDFAVQLLFCVTSSGHYRLKFRHGELFDKIDDFFFRLEREIWRTAHRQSLCDKCCGWGPDIKYARRMSLLSRPAPSRRTCRSSPKSTTKDTATFPTRPLFRYSEQRYSDFKFDFSNRTF